MRHIDLARPLSVEHSAAETVPSAQQTFCDNDTCVTPWQPPRCGGRGSWRNVSCCVILMVQSCLSKWNFATWMWIIFEEIVQSLKFFESHIDYFFRLLAPQSAELQLRLEFQLSPPWPYFLHRCSSLFLTFGSIWCCFRLFSLSYVWLFFFLNWHQEHKSTFSRNRFRWLWC